MDNLVCLEYIILFVMYTLIEYIDIVMSKIMNNQIIRTL